MDRIRIRLVASNYQPGLLVLPAKISAGMLHKHDADYYMTVYPRVKADMVAKWALEAASGFPSALEHVVFTYLVEGCSRVCSHQLVRHRLASYTQESMRYSEGYLEAMALEACRRQDIECERGDYKAYADALRRYWREYALAAMLSSSIGDLEAAPLVELARIAYVIPARLAPIQQAELALHYIRSTEAYYRLLSIDTKREDARYLVPQAVRTRILATINLRELLHILQLRTSKAAQAEIRLVACRMAEETIEKAPEIGELLTPYSCREIMG